MAPIASAQTIPDDILYEVFREFVRGWNQDASSIGAKTGSYSTFSMRRQGGWIPSLTHVCRRWRTFALNTCALWTNIVFGAGGGTLAFLDRARAAPLRVTGEVWDLTSGDSILRTLGTVLDRSEQIVVLDLQLPTVEPPNFSTLGRRLFPNVASLSLSRQSGNSTGGEITLPQFFDPRCNLVSLKKLRLQNYTITTVLHSALSLCKITTFELEACHRLPMGLTLDVLKNMPCLEELTVAGFFQPAEWDYERYSDIVPLTRLRQLSLYSMASGAATFLNHLKVSTVTAVKLSLIGDNVTTDEDLIFNWDMPLIATAIADTLFAPDMQKPFPKITALAIHLSDWGAHWHASHIRGWTSPSPLAALPVSDARLLDEDTADARLLDEDTDDAPTPSFDVRLTGFTSTAIIQHLCMVLPLEHVQILFVSNCKHSYEYGRELTRQIWQDLLVRMPALCTLSATLDAIASLPVLLRPETDTDGETHVLLPHLRSLSVRHYETPRTHEPRPSRMEELTESLLRRAESGNEIDFDFGWIPDAWYCF